MLRVLSLAALWLLVGCRAEKASTLYEREANEILAELRARHCAMDSLHAISVALWDSVSRELDARLPADMPSDERRNMLNVRNTGLIQMFQVYPQLDTNIQQLVVWAGERDDELALALRLAQNSLIKSEQRADSLLVALSREHPDALPDWKARYGRVTCE